MRPYNFAVLQIFAGDAAPASRNIFSLLKSVPFIDPQKGCDKLLYHTLIFYVVILETSALLDEQYQNMN